MDISRLEKKDPGWITAYRAGHQTGETVRAVWPEAEGILHYTWCANSFGLTWDEARQAMREGWLDAKRTD
jgi:hypothetical protein